MFANAANLEKSIQKLSKALEKEIKYENENYSQLEDIETFLNESGFQFNEVEGEITMTLTKQVGDKTVEVVFEARYVIVIVFVSLISLYVVDFNIIL